jgi:hypothetical protein
MTAFDHWRQNRTYLLQNIIHSASPLLTSNFITAVAIVCACADECKMELVVNFNCSRYNTVIVQLERTMAKFRTYCNALNDSTEKTCVACGAPLDAPVPQVTMPPVVQQAFTPAQTGTPFDSLDSQKLQSGAQQVDRLYQGAASAYQTAWSVTGDAIAISTVAVILGLVGGATGMGFWGVLGMLAGLVVGYTDQFSGKYHCSPGGRLAWSRPGLSPPRRALGRRDGLRRHGLACLGALSASAQHLSAARSYARYWSSGFSLHCWVDVWAGDPGGVLAETQYFASPMPDKRPATVWIKKYYPVERTFMFPAVSLPWWSCTARSMRPDSQGKCACRLEFTGCQDWE